MVLEENRRDGDLSLYVSLVGLVKISGQALRITINAT